MCLTPDIPDPPSPAERQAAHQPATDIRSRASDRERRKRGFAATMFASPAAGAATTTNVLGV